MVGTGCEAMRWLRVWLVAGLLLTVWPVVGRTQEGAGPERWAGCWDVVWGGVAAAAP